MNRLFTAFFIFFSFTHYAQESDFNVNSLGQPIHQFSSSKAGRVASDNKNTFSAAIGYFDPWIGIAYERVFFAHWGLDVSAGLIGGSIGTKFYFPKLADGKVSVLIGVSEGILLLVGTKHYIPVGMTYLGKSGFRLSVDVGPQLYHGETDQPEIGFSLRLGKAF